MTIHFDPVPEEPRGLFEAFGLPAAPGAVSRTSTADGNECYTSGDTVLVYNRSSGAVDLRTSASESHAQVDFSDEEAVDLASEYLNRNRGLLTIAGAGSSAVGMAVTEIRHTVEGSGDLTENATQRRTQTTVVFRPLVDGIPTIGTGGVVEVSLNGDRQIARVRSVLRSVASVERGTVTRDVQQYRQEAERRALEEVRSTPNVDRAQLVKSEFGFYSADEAEQQTTSRPAFRILVEMQGGPFSRLVEKVYYLDELD